jgi:hypothetical protein
LLDFTTTTLQSLTNTLTNGVQAIGDALHGITSTLGDALGPLGHAIGGLVGGPATPAAAAADLLTHNGTHPVDAPQPDATSAATAFEPQSGASSITMLDGHALASDAVAPIHVDMAPLQLGFIGQSYADPGDPHDGRLSACMDLSSRILMDDRQKEIRLVFDEARSVAG